MSEIQSFREGCQTSMTQSLIEKGYSGYMVHQVISYMSFLAKSELTLTVKCFSAFLPLLTPKTICVVGQEILDRHLYFKRSQALADELRKLINIHEGIISKSSIKDHLTTQKQIREFSTAGLMEDSFKQFIDEIDTFQEACPKSVTDSLTRLGFSKNEIARYSSNMRLFRCGQKEMTVDCLLFLEPLLSKQLFCRIGKELLRTEQRTSPNDTDVQTLRQIIQDHEPGYALEHKRYRRALTKYYLSKAWAVNG